MPTQKTAPGPARGVASGAALGPGGGTLVASQLKRSVNPSHFHSQFHFSQTSVKADVGMDYV